MRRRDAVQAARFGKTRCWKDHKCYVLRCTRPPRRQRNARRYIVFFDPRNPKRVWKYACEEHSRGLRRIGKVYRAQLKRIALGAQRALVRHGLDTDEKIDAYLAQLAAERERLAAEQDRAMDECFARFELKRRARSEAPESSDLLLAEDAPDNLRFLRDPHKGRV